MSHAQLAICAMGLCGRVVGEQGATQTVLPNLLLLFLESSFSIFSHQTQLALERQKKWSFCRGCPFCEEHLATTHIQHTLKLKQKFPHTHENNHVSIVRRVPEPGLRVA